MNLRFALASAAFSVTCLAQSPSLLFAPSLTEQSSSGSGGTVLQTLRPNEVSVAEFVPCPIVSAEKWSPRSCYDTMAGDDDANGWIHDALRFGTIDALLDVPSPISLPNQRTVFWSPSQSMGTANSGAPGLRPGDTGRIVYNTSGFGLVEYFLRAEDLQIALGLPPTPIVVDVDAIACDLGTGIYFSLNNNLPVAGSCGLTFAQDGDVMVIPSSAITWTFDFRVAAVVPGSAEMVYPEWLMDLFVQNANVADANGNCVTTVGDVEGLEIDTSATATSIPGCTGTPSVRAALLFTATTLTGCSILTTANAGQIWNSACGPLGTACGSGPTLGLQLGMQPPSSSVGVPSFVNAMALSFTGRFVLEPQQHVVPLGSPAIIDCYSPGAVAFVFAAISPPTVAPCIPFPNLLFPDVYVINWVWNTFTGPGFTTFATPPVNIPAKVVFQAGTFAPNLVLSTPCTVEW